MELKEFFVPVPGYEGRYIINPYGDVKRTDHERVYANKIIHYPEMNIKSNIDERSGYKVVKLTKPDGSYGSQYVHRLVALAFIPKPPQKSFVNHKNGDKTDSFYQNLEWVTASENHKHAIAKSLIKIPPRNKVKVQNKCTGDIYESIKAAAKACDLTYDEAKRKIRGLRSKDICLEKYEGES